MAKRKYPLVKDGERVHPVMDNYGMACYDCGLVHRLDFTVVKVKKSYPDGSWTYTELDRKKYRVVFKARRDNRASGQLRRHSKT